MIAAAEELLEELVESGRVRTAGQLAELRAASARVVMDVAEREVEKDERRENARFWRERMPGLAEAMTTPANERFPATEVESVADELGIDLDRIDLAAICTEGPAAGAYMSGTGRQFQLHRDLGVPENRPLSRQSIERATKEPGGVGRRARLAVRLLALAPRSARR